MQLNICSKCGLSLPSSLLKPYIMMMKGRRRRVFLCVNCIKEIEEIKNQKTKGKNGS